MDEREQEKIRVLWKKLRSIPRRLKRVRRAAQGNPKAMLPKWARRGR